MAERCIDASIAIKWFIREKFTMQLTPHLPNCVAVNSGRQTGFSMMM